MPKSTVGRSRIYHSYLAASASECPSCDSNEEPEVFDVLRFGHSPFVEFVCSDCGHVATGENIFKADHAWKNNSNPKIVKIS